MMKSQEPDRSSEIPKWRIYIFYLSLMFGIISTASGFYTYKTIYQECTNFHTSKLVNLNVSLSANCTWLTDYRLCVYDAERVGPYGWMDIFKWEKHEKHICEVGKGPVSCNLIQVKYSDYFRERCELEPFRLFASGTPMFIQILSLPLHPKWEDYVEKHYQQKKWTRILYQLAPLIAQLGMYIQAWTAYLLPSSTFAWSNLNSLTLPFLVFIGLYQSYRRKNHEMLESIMLAAFWFPLFYQTLSLIGFIVVSLIFVQSHPFQDLYLMKDRFMGLMTFFVFSFLSFILKPVAKYVVARLRRTESKR